MEGGAARINVTERCFDHIRYRKFGVVLAKARTHNHRAKSLREMAIADLRQI